LSYAPAQEERLQEGEHDYNIVHNPAPGALSY